MNSHTIELNHKKRTKLISSHLDRTSSVNKGFIIRQKHFALLWIKNELFTSTAGKESYLCLQQNKPTRVAYVSFVLNVLRCCLRLHRRLCPKSYELCQSASRNFFFLNGIEAGNPERGRWAHLAHSGSQSEHRIRFILPTSATSCITRKATGPTVAELKKGSKDPNVQDLMKVDKAIMSFPLVGYEVASSFQFTSHGLIWASYRSHRAKKKKKKKKYSRTY